jgi:hypothetical protein
MARRQPQLRLDFEGPKKNRVATRPLGRPKVPRRIVQCSICGADIERYPSALNRHTGKRFFCTSCFYAARKRGLRPTTFQARELDRVHNGRRARLDHHGYVLIYESSRARRRTSLPKGWDHEHRVVAERMIGRCLRKGEHVHHINGIKTDNRPENLQVLTAQAHRKLHSDEITEKLRRLADYERLYGPLREGPVTEASLRTLKTKGVQ